VRVKNPLSIRRHRKETVAGLTVEVGVEEEPLDLASIQRKTADLLARGDLKGLVYYVASILKVILKSDDDKDGSVFIFPRELAIKRGIRGATKLALALVVRLVYVVVGLTLSWAVYYLPWLANARFLLVHGAVHFLAFSALLDFVMAGFGWAIVREAEAQTGGVSDPSSVYYHIAEAFYDPYFSASLGDFWGRRYNTGLHDTLSVLIRSVVPSSSLSSSSSSPATKETEAVRRALTGLPLYLAVVGLLNFVIYFVVERQLVFSVLLFFSVHACLVLLQALVAEADADATLSSSASPASNLLLFVGQKLRKARDVALPTANVRKWAGAGLFWLALYLTLPLYFADDHDQHDHPGASSSGPTFFFNIWVAATPTPTPVVASSWW
jgi:hypothetical protein